MHAFKTHWNGWDVCESSRMVCRTRTSTSDGVVELPRGVCNRSLIFFSFFLCLKWQGNLPESGVHPRFVHPCTIQNVFWAKSHENKNGKKRTERSSWVFHVAVCTPAFSLCLQETPEMTDVGCEMGKLIHWSWWWWCRHFTPAVFWRVENCLHTQVFYQGH